MTTVGSSTLGGGFVLLLGPDSTAPLPANASALDVAIALAALPSISVQPNVSVAGPSSVGGFTWSVTFDGVDGDLPDMRADLSGLTGNDANIVVATLRNGTTELPIAGSPFWTSVQPAAPDASISTAYGTGLVSQVALQPVQFTVQLKDRFGNDRLSNQSESAVIAEAFLPSSTAAHNGTVTSVGEGQYAVSFIPTRTGDYTLAVALLTQPEVQTVTLTFPPGSTNADRAGSFILSYAGDTTAPLPWDSSAASVTTALTPLPSMPLNLTVVRSALATPGAADGYAWAVTFASAPGIFLRLVAAPSASGLLPTGTAVSSVVTQPVVRSHVKTAKAPLRFERQAITVAAVDPLSNISGTFLLEFNRVVTSPIPWDASAAAVSAALSGIPSAGNVTATRQVDPSGTGWTWIVTFVAQWPPINGAISSTRALGNLPLLGSHSYGLGNGALTVSQSGLVGADGISPFTVTILPAPVSGAQCTAYDANPGGLSTGTYATTASFSLEGRDAFGNRLPSGPAKEVQILTLTSSPSAGANLSSLLVGSSLSLGLRGSFSSGVPLADSRGHLMDPVLLANALQAVPTIGGVSVTLTNWTYSSAEYAITFDTELGDIPSLQVDASNVAGGVNAAIMACDTRRVQTVTTSVAGGSALGGYFTLSYGPYETTRLRHDANATAVRNALQALWPITAASVTRAGPSVAGEYTWTVTLTSLVNDADPLSTPSLLFAEGRWLTGLSAKVAVAGTCPSSPNGQTAVAGSLGAQFAVHLTGFNPVTPVVVDGDVSYPPPGVLPPGTGEYFAQYVVPRVDTYAMDVSLALRGGLNASYYNNRWLLGAPALTRIDPTIDFSWEGYITPTGRDYISVRWTGFVAVPFNESFTFHVQANDGARLIVGGSTLIDQLDHVHNASTDSCVYMGSRSPDCVEWTGVTVSALVAGRLYPITLEFRENTGTAVARLFYSSPSHPKRLIPSNRLFYGSVPIAGSPFLVQPIGVVPYSPQNASIIVASSTDLAVTWAPPIDDGGDDVTGYRVRFYRRNASSLVEKQSVVVTGVTSGAYSLSLPGLGVTGPLQYDESAATVAAALQKIPGLGLVDVTCNLHASPLLPCDATAVGSGVAVYSVSFTTYVDETTGSQDVPSLAVIPQSVSYGSGGTIVTCASGAMTPNCGPTDSWDGGRLVDVCTGTTANGSAILGCPTVPAYAMDASTGTYSYTITGLLPGQTYFARVSSFNTRGLGLPSLEVTEVPRAVPSVVQRVTVALAPSSATSLQVYFVTPVTANGDPVANYTVQWSTGPSFAAVNGTVTAPPVTFASSLPQRDFPGTLEYRITGLTPGGAYYVRVRAANSVGEGPWAISQPTFESPRMQPSSVPYGHVLLRAVLADEVVSVADSTTTLQALWAPPLSPEAAGDIITAYRLEWFTAPGRAEVQALSFNFGSLTSGNTGAWAAVVDGERSAWIPYDADAATVKSALEGLTDVPEVEVSKDTPDGQRYVYYVTFTGVIGNMGAPLTVDSHLYSWTGTNATVTVTRLGQAAVYTDAMTSAPYAAWSIASGDVRMTASGALAVSLAPGSYLRIAADCSPLNPGSIARVVSTAYDTIGDVTTVTLDAPYRFPSAAGACAFTGPEVIGAEPGDYQETLIPASDLVITTDVSALGAVVPAAGSGYYSYTLRGLVPNTRYYVRVSAVNGRGSSVPQVSSPEALAPPRQKPDVPQRVSLYAQSSSSLRVSWYAPASDGGDPVSKYLVEWDTKATFGSLPGGRSLGYQDVPMPVGIGACGTSPCDFIITGLAQGTPYYVRVYAYNGLGFSVRPGLPLSASQAPRTFAAPPTIVRLFPDTDSSLRVEFPPSPNTGGAAVTKYRIEWDILGADAVTYGATQSSVPYSWYDVQEVRLTDTSALPTGSFRLAFRDVSSGDIAADASAYDITQALSSLPTVGSVSVDRITIGGAATAGSPRGYAWRVTFTAVPGKQPLLAVSTNGGSDYLQVMTGVAGASLSPSTSRLEVNRLVQGMDGFETQEVTVDVTAGGLPAPVLAGSFTLSFQGRSTVPLAVNATASEVEAALEALGASLAGDVMVTRRISTSGAGFTWRVAFLTSLGDQPLMTADGSAISPGYRVTVTPVSNGRLPAMDSILKGTAELLVGNATTAVSTSPLRYTIAGLRRGSSYHVRVAAWNGIGAEYGPTQYCTPASVAVVPAPAGVQRITVTTVSTCDLAVAWEPPSNVAPSEVTSYRVEWDTNVPVSEQQIVTVAAGSAGASPGGFFSLVFRGQTTALISPTASSDDLKQSLEVLGGVNSVTVSRSAVTGGFAWIVTFTGNIGPQPLMRMVPDTLTGPRLTNTVTRLREGTWPAFDRGTVGVSVRPLGSIDLPSRPEVQTIRVAADATDLDGSFTLVFNGQTTVPIGINDTASVVATKLSSIAAIGAVNVGRSVLRYSPEPPTVPFGVEWTVTFVDPINRGDVPLLLASTDGGAHSGPLAAGGSLTGTGARVSVSETAKGGVPASTTLSGLSTGTPYFVRVAASTYIAGPSVVAPFSAIPHAAAPAAPSQVAVRPVGPSSLLVSWAPPPSDGGAPVSTYYVQWSTSADFSPSQPTGSEPVPANGTASDVTGLFSFPVTGLDPARTYFVRVLASNAAGYSAPAAAMPAANREEVQLITLKDTGGAPVAAGQWRLSLGVYSTRLLSFDATGADVQSALQALPNAGTVAVQRVDARGAVDGTQTPGADGGLSWLVTFLTADPATPLPVLSASDNTTADVEKEVQSISVFTSGGGGALTGGSYALSVGTDPVTSDVTACIPIIGGGPALQAALNAVLPTSIDPSCAVTVTPASITSPGSGSSYGLVFTSPCGDVPQLSPVSVGSGACAPFTGGSGPQVLAETLQNGSPGGAAVIGFVPTSAGVSVTRLRSGSMDAVTARPQSVLPSSPVNVTLSVVSDTELGVTWSAPTFPGAASGGAAVTKYRVEWSASPQFPSSDASDPTVVATSSAFVDSSCNPSYCDWAPFDGRYKYKIDAAHPLSTGTAYYVRVSAFSAEPLYTSLLTVGGYSDPTTAAPVPQSPSKQLPWAPFSVVVNPSPVQAGSLFRNAEDQLEVNITDPQFNRNGFRTRDGTSGNVSDIRWYRIEYDNAPSFDSGLGGTPLGSYDEPNYYRNTDGTEPLGDQTRDCSGAGGCLTHLGAELQSLTLSTVQGPFTSGSYKVTIGPNSNASPSPRPRFRWWLPSAPLSNRPVPVQIQCPSLRGHALTSLAAGPPTTSSSMGPT